MASFILMDKISPYYYPYLLHPKPCLLVLVFICVRCTWCWFCRLMTRTTLAVPPQCSGEQRQQRWRHATGPAGAVSSYFPPRLNRTITLTSWRDVTTYDLGDWPSLWMIIFVIWNSLWYAVGPATWPAGPLYYYYTSLQRQIVGLITLLITITW